MFLSRVLPAVGVLVLIAGCTGQKQEMERIANAPMRVDYLLDEDAEFTGYTTWLMLPTPTGGGGLADPRIKTAEFKQDLNDAVQAEMFSRGYQRIETGMPDLAVNFMLAVDPIDPKAIGSQFPDYQMDLTESEAAKTKVWERGTLVLFFFDTKTQQMIFRSAVQTEVNLDLDRPRADTQKRISKAVKLMMESFPARRR
ncbi:MAG: DUF4136 domain-containing protein [bacterium]|nr:DUF4136 domain-containing protein [bacterium]